MRIIALAATAVLLSGCWYGELRSEMTPAQLAQVDDARFCRAANYAAHSLLARGSTSQAFKNEYDRRFMRGVDCGLPVEIASREAGSNAAIGLVTLGLAGAALAQPARPAMIVPRAIDCQSTGNGRYISCW